jgi:hypothetical protein
MQEVSCSGLRPGARYSLAAARANASRRGVARFSSRSHRLGAGQALSLRNGAGRVLTRLHVAHLRAAIRGNQTVLAGGRCQPGDYYGPGLLNPPISAGIGLGVAGDGVVCPDTGNPAGLSSAHISQIDDLSGGVTRTEVPMIVRTTPLNGETLYGRFIAQARAALAGPDNTTAPAADPISLKIARAASRKVVFSSRNVNLRHGVSVRSLRRGTYVATWVLRDVNGDTRTIQTGFVEAGPSRPRP